MDKILVKVEDLDLARILNVAVPAVPCFGQFNVLIKKTLLGCKLKQVFCILYFAFVVGLTGVGGGGGGDE